jgi:hypothetical protein
MSDQIPLHIYLDGWQWKAQYEPLIVDGVEKSTRVVPFSLVEALIIKAEDYSVGNYEWQDVEKCIAALRELE